MNRLTEEWIEKAEGDFHTALREHDAAKDQNYDAVCFHSQQCIEKYLKARLQEAGVNFDRTHVLPDLLNLALNVEPTWQTMQSSLSTLTPYQSFIAIPACPLQKRMLRKQFVSVALSVQRYDLP